MVLPSGGSTTATLTFYPRELAKYKDVVQFQINGLSTHDVTVTGDGTEMRVSDTVMC